MINSTLCYLEKNNKYLMLHRTKKEVDCNKGKWIGVGGKVEEGESITECLEREVLEETGIRLRSYRIRGIISFNSDIWENEKMFLFTSEDFEGDVDRVCDEGDLKWIDKDKVMDLNLWDGDRIFLKKLAEDEPFFFMRLDYEGDELVKSHIGGETFDEKVYEQVARIPYGMVTNYGDIACLAGYPGAARAVGNALHRNPYDGVIPCHRIVNAEGRLSHSFCFGGWEEQAFRLREEGVKVVGDKVVK